MKLLTRVNSIFDGTIGTLAILAAILIVFIMLAVSADVIMRYFLNRPTVWLIEISEYCLLFITFMSAGWVLKREGHVKMDLMLNRLSSRRRTLLNTITSITGTITCLAIVWFGAVVTWEFYQIGYFTHSELKLPKFIFLLIITIGMFFLSIQFIKRTYGYLRSFRMSRDQTNKL